MKILFYGVGEFSLKHAFPTHFPETILKRKDFPHEVLTFGYHDGVDFRLRPEDEFCRILQELPVNWRPDFAVLYNADTNLLPKGIEKAPFPVVYVAFDWDYSIHTARTIAESVDLVVVRGDTAQKAMRALGAADVRVHYDQGIDIGDIPETTRKINKRTYDIFYSTFIDDLKHPDRSAWIVKLSELSDRYKVCVAPHLPNYRQYLNLLQDSKLVFSHNRMGEMSIRVVEAASQGAVALDPGSEVGKYFEADAEYLPITPDGLSEVVDHHLNEPEALHRISSAARSRVVSEFGGEQRLLGFLKVLQNRCPGKTGARVFPTLSDAERCIRRGEVFYFAFFRKPPLGHDRSYVDLLRLSIDEFEKAVRMEPSPRALTDLALAESSWDFVSSSLNAMDTQGGRSCSLLGQAIDSEPGYVMAHFNLGLIHFRLGQHDEALGMFKKTLCLLDKAGSIVDPWCLYSLETEWQPERFFSLDRMLNMNLLLWVGGNAERAEQGIRNLYKAATLYYIATLELEGGRCYHALEALRTAYRMEPASALVARRAAFWAAVLGFEDESLGMYETAVGLAPLNIDLRMEYLKVLYLYERDCELVDKLNATLKIVKTVRHLGEKIGSLQTLLSEMDRFNSTSYFAHDACKNGLLSDWAGLLYRWLEKNPKDLSLTKRLVDVLARLNRPAEILDVLETCVANCSTEGDKALYTFVCEIYHDLFQKSTALTKRIGFQLDRLNQHNENSFLSRGSGNTVGRVD